MFLNFVLLGVSLLGRWRLGSEITHPSAHA
jgi:hypothetical protein